MEELKGLVRLRARLLTAKKQLKTPLIAFFLAAAKQKRLESCCAGTLKHLEADMAQIEQAIQGLVASEGQESGRSGVDGVEGLRYKRSAAQGNNPADSTLPALNTKNAQQKTPPKPHLKHS